MKEAKTVKTRRSYDSDFKQEVTRMLVSGRSTKEVSESFGIAENLLYRWKRMATMKTKTKHVEGEGSKAAKLAAENAKLRAEVERLKTDREILKKALGLPYNLYKSVNIIVLTASSAISHAPIRISSFM
ncbi:transposase [Dyadobacter sp. MSC1_007]|jgi:transposase|uniref:transposase n=1 Tax=Dyadobacter sp. MSC1_007 TaxID=2909264 RepID=UPI00202FFF39|nr:transposase [Dyadobacter sp. MSC1_007]